MAKVGDTVQYLYEDGGQPVAAIITTVHQNDTVDLTIFGPDWSDFRLGKALGTEPNNWREIQ